MTLDPTMPAVAGAAKAPKMTARTALRPRRSVLYVPADHARALDKATRLPADVVILDLEDAVAPEAKEAGRAMIGALLSRTAFGSRETVVRINAADTPWFDADLALVATCSPDAVLVPKLRCAADLLGVAQALAARHCQPALWAMIETPQAVLDLRTILAQADEGLRALGTHLGALVLGLNDLSRETGVRQEPGRMAMAGILLATVLAARTLPERIDVIDGVCLSLDDTAQLEAEAVQARAFGCDGKSLIHPAQIAVANRVFAPAETDLAEARVLVAAFGDPAHAGRNVLTLNGRMVERLHLDMAQRTLALAAAIAMHDDREVPPRGHSGGDPI